MNLAAFTPHGFCLAWQPGLIWLHAASDLLTALSYYSIPAALIVVLRRRRDLAFRPVFFLFAAFITACGTTHLLGMLTLWVPVYWLEGAVKAFTAALSVVTAIVLWPLLPKALSLPSPAELRALNARLEQQVAERDLAVGRLNESRQRLRQLYARTPAPLHATNAEGTLVEVSDRWLTLFGYRRDQVIGRRIIEFYVPEQSIVATEHLAALRDGGGDRHTERRIRRGDGDVRDVEATYELERDGCGQLERILVALTDVTDRKRAEVALHASEERLRQAQKMEAVGQLTGGIAHDFNNLLTTIMGSLELLGRQGGLDARGQRLARNAMEGSQRAARLTSQLLSFARRQRLQPERLAPAEVAMGIRDLLRRAGGEPAQLSMPPPDPSQWQVLADRNQLESTLLNLVINARDAIGQAAHTTSDGTVSIRFAQYSLTHDDVEALAAEHMAPGDFVGIAVIDNGPGMTPEVMAHAFEPFFTTKPVGSGTGLGLSQAFGFATQSGGTVRIDSGPGRGTCVEVLLPRAAVVGEPDHVPVVLGAGSTDAIEAGDGRTVLVVEDDALLRLTVAEGLRQRGYTVIEAPDGRAALTALHHCAAVDFLFTDVMMPGGLDGVAVARAARQLRSDLKIMFATGYSDRRVLDGWPETLDLVQKPYSLDTVASRIASRLRQTAPVA